MLTNQEMWYNEEEEKGKQVTKMTTHEITSMITKKIENQTKSDYGISCNIMSRRDM